MKKFLFLSIFIFSFISISIAETPTEKLLKNYNPELAIRASTMIEEYKKRKNVTPRAMTNVAKTIFRMYGFKNADIVASYGGSVSKAVIHKGSGRTHSKFRIYVAERRDKKLEHHDKAYGNDTFIHELLHSLGFAWKAKGVVKTHGLSHSNKEEKIYFEKCRKILVGAIHNTEKNKEIIKKNKEKLFFRR